MPIKDDDPNNDLGTPSKEHPDWLRNLVISLGIAFALFSATLIGRSCHQPNPQQPVKYVY